MKTNVTKTNVTKTNAMKNPMGFAYIILMAVAGAANAGTVAVGMIDATFAERVKTVRTTTGKPTGELTVSGIVTSDPDRSVSYIPPFNGVVLRTPFTLGMKVEKGMTMLEMRSPELSALQAEAAGAEAELKSATRGLRWAEEMFADKLVSEIELYDAREKVCLAEAETERVRANMEMFGMSRGRGVFSIPAPIGGHVIGKHAAEGMTVAEGGDALFTIADLETVVIVAGIHASNIAFVREGMEARISSVSYPDQVFAGRVGVVSQVFDPEDKVLKAYIVMDNADLKFKPGMSVEVRLMAPADRSMVALPAGALIFDNNRHYAVVRGGGGGDASGNFSVREVSVYHSDRVRSYIESGLAEGDEVVVRDHLLIYAGLRGI